MGAASERAGALVIRAWVELDETTLRARIRGRLDLAKPDETSCVVVGVESATEVVRGWLEEFERGRVGSVTEA